MWIETKQFQYDHEFFHLFIFFEKYFDRGSWPEINDARGSGVGVNCDN